MADEKAIAYNRKYNEDNYARIGLYLPPEEKARWQKCADEKGISMSSFIKACVNNCIGEPESN